MTHTHKLRAKPWRRPACVEMSENTNFAHDESITCEAVPQIGYRTQFIRTMTRRAPVLGTFVRVQAQNKAKVFPSAGVDRTLPSIPMCFLSGCMVLLFGIKTARPRVQYASSSKASTERCFCSQVTLKDDGFEIVSMLEVCTKQCSVQTVLELVAQWQE